MLVGRRLARRLPLTRSPHIRLVSTVPTQQLVEALVAAAQSAGKLIERTTHPEHALDVVDKAHGQRHWKLQGGRSVELSGGSAAEGESSGGLDAPEEVKQRQAQQQMHFLQHLDIPVDEWKAKVRRRRRNGAGETRTPMTSLDDVSRMEVVSMESSDEGETHSVEFVDPQSTADVSSQWLIVQVLRDHFPGLRVVAEESGALCLAGRNPATLLDSESSDSDYDSDEAQLKHEMRELAHEVLATNDVVRGVFEEHPIADDLRNLDMSKLTVYIDPLDGTREFLIGHHESVTVLLGVAYGNRPLIGVAHSPFPHRTAWGVVGYGLQPALDKPFVPYHETEAHEHGRRIITSRHFATTALLELVRSRQPDKVIGMGGAGHKVLALLDGQADAWLMPQTGTSLWDTCAAEALLSADGQGCLTDAYGDAIDYDPFQRTYRNTRGVCASRCPRDHLSFCIDASAAELTDLLQDRRTVSIDTTASDPVK